jgi:Holliday junction resolvase
MIKIKTARQKGKDLEDFIADKLKEKGLDSKARRDGGSGSGNREKADICTSAQLFGRNLGIEAKNRKTLHIPDWWRQVEKLEELGREPILIYKIPRRNPKVHLVSIYLETFLDMLVALQGVDNTASNVVENYHYDKVNILNSIKYIRQSLGRLERDYTKKLLKEE